MDPNLPHGLIFQHDPMVTVPINNRANLDSRWWKISLIPTGKIPGYLYRGESDMPSFLILWHSGGPFFLVTILVVLAHPGGDINLQRIV